MWRNDDGNGPLASELKALFDQQVNEDQQLISGVTSLAQEYGHAVYSEALFHLAGKRFSDEFSQRYWQGVLDHRQTVFRAEYTSAALRPALLDYLSRVVGELTDPRIIDAESLNHIRKSSITDGLTGLYCQTFFKQYVAKILANNRRGSDDGFAVLFFDLDTFKQYNDRCGHLCGDEALRRTAELIRKCLREGDVAARYGGEEFAVYLPQVNRGTALLVAERIRSAIEQEVFCKEELLDRGSLTISGGVSIYPEDGDKVTTLLEVADQNLYHAKIRRNCIYSLHVDRRRGLRRKIHSLVEYAHAKSTVFHAALTQDISDFDMTLGCSSAIKSGEILSLRLARPYWAKDLLLRGTVRQVRYQNEMFYIGLEFEKSLQGETAALSLLLQPSKEHVVQQESSCPDLRCH